MAKKPTIYFCLTILEGFVLYQVFAFNFVLSSPAEDNILLHRCGHNAHDADRFIIFTIETQEILIFLRYMGMCDSQEIIHI